MLSTRNFHQYSKKVFGINEFIEPFLNKEKFKQFSTAAIIWEVISALTTGLKSLNGVSNGGEGKYSRNAIVGGLSHGTFPRRTRRYMKILVQKMKPRKCNTGDTDNYFYCSNEKFITPRFVEKPLLYLFLSEF